jgi:Coenzyme PQQ synthesis protein D (PqqD)
MEDAQKLKNLAISGNGFIFDPATGHSYTANETALFLIQKISEGLEISELVKELVDAYNVDEATAERDVVSMVEHLKSNYLV